MGEPLLKVAQKAGDSVSGPVRTLRVKMVLLGSSGVGKSSLALRFGEDRFRNTSPTVGCAYLTQLVHLGDVSLRFEIWDTAGQEKYHSVTPLYYRGAHAALVVYDISSRDTFIRAQLWIQELEKQYIPGSTVLWLVGNKADRDQNRQVSTQEGLGLAGSRGLSFTETSALSGERVSQLLSAVAHRVYESIGEQQGGLSEWKENLLLDQNQNQNQSSCCRAGP
ncbi:ras-related protein Rab-17-like isoform X1 [Cyprinodon tularosa]|uniref:ras-related protein Rab-17-like isoform X1 n=1 Tax=Cyprinodon tularosa TaxID=77115 RepID=UPI0018E232A4|nr:ras-related protein Rab-17-like isoform X1 [Cyprinodon tularosa]